MSSILPEAKRYLWLEGCRSLDTVDPKELIRDLVKECETLKERNKKLYERVTDLEADVQPKLPLEVKVA